MKGATCQALSPDGRLLLSGTLTGLAALRTLAAPYRRLLLRVPRKAFLTRAAGHPPRHDAHRSGFVAAFAVC